MPERLIPSGDLTHDSAWHTIDIAQYLDNQDAQAVTFRVYKTSAESFAGLREVGSTEVDIVSVRSAMFFIDIINLKGGTEIEYRSANINIGFSITGELSSNAQLHPFPILLDVDGDDFDEFLLRTPTLIGNDQLSDITGVIVKIYNAIWPLGSFFFVREAGSMDGLVGLGGNGGRLWTVVGINENGNYETSTSGSGGTDEDVKMWEVGYFKNIAAIHTVKNKEDQGMTGTGGANWIEHKLNGISVPLHSQSIGLRIHNANASNRAGYVRNLNDTTANAGRIIFTISCQSMFVSPNAAGFFEFAGFNSSVDFFVEWYESTVIAKPPSVKLIQDSRSVSASITDLAVTKSNGIMDPRTVSTHLEQPNVR